MFTSNFPLRFFVSFRIRLFICNILKRNTVYIIVLLRWDSGALKYLRVLWYVTAHKRIFLYKCISIVYKNPITVLHRFIIYILSRLQLDGTFVHFNSVCIYVTIGQLVSVALTNTYNGNEALPRQIISPFYTYSAAVFS